MKILNVFNCVVQKYLDFIKLWYKVQRILKLKISLVFYLSCSFSGLYHNKVALSNGVLKFFSLNYKFHFVLFCFI